MYYIIFVECISNETTISIPVYDVESDSKYVLTMITVATFDDVTCRNVSWLTLNSNDSTLICDVTTFLETSSFAVDSLV